MNTLFLFICALLTFLPIQGFYSEPLDSISKANPQSLSYEEKRESFVQDLLYTDNGKYSGITFSTKDQDANTLFYQKTQPILNKFPLFFYHHYAMGYKDEITNSKFFKNLQAMPKGVILHHHLASDVDLKWITKVSDNSNTYYCNDTGRNWTGLCYTTKPAPGDRPINEVIQEWQKAHPSEDREGFFIEHMRISVQNMSNFVASPQIFGPAYERYHWADHFIFYKKFYRAHVMNMLRKYVDDKVYRLETRADFGVLTDENMEPIPLEDEMDIYNDCLDEIRKIAPNFTFAIIIQMKANWNATQLQTTMRKAFEQKLKYPNLIAGLDMTGAETRYPPEVVDIFVMKTAFEEEYNIEMPWILHVGASTIFHNSNVIDAYLINATRIGHGVNIMKHSYLLEKFRAAKTTIEICPISHQDLLLVTNLRLHPAPLYFNFGLKVTINPDDPTPLNTTGMAYDYFVAMASYEFDMLDLKVLLLNTIEGSVATANEKKHYLGKFAKDWDEWLDAFMNDWS